MICWLQLNNRKYLHRKHGMYLEKLSLIEKVPLESNDSGRVNKGVFDPSEDNSIFQEELLSTKTDSSELLCVKEKGYLKSEGGLIGLSKIRCPKLSNTIFYGFSLPY